MYSPYLSFPSEGFSKHQPPRSFLALAGHGRQEGGSARQAIDRAGKPPEVGAHFC